MGQVIRRSGYQVIRFLLALFFLQNYCFAKVPQFYGDEVVVTALRIPRLRSQVPWNTEVISRAEIDRSGALKLGDVIRTKPGLSLKSTGGLGAQISSRFRGSNNSQVLVLLNGNRINSPSLGLYDLGDILLTGVEKVEIVKAPLSAIYGADAIGGVINILTLKPGNRETVKHNFSMSYGEYSTQNYSISSVGPHYSFAAASLYSAGFRTNSDYKADDVNLRLSADIGKANIEVGAKKYSSNRGTPGSLDYLTPQARQVDVNNFYDLVYRAPQVGLKVAWSQTNLWQNYQNPQSWPAIDTTTQTMSTNTDISERFSLWGNNILSGVEMRTDQGGGTNAGSNQIENKAVYFQDEFKIGDLANIVVGARQDLNATYGNHLSPRVGLVFAPLPKTYLKMSWGSSFKAPTINDLYWTKLTETSNWGGVTYVSTTEGNASLLAETSQSIDLTLEKKFDKDSSARISYFANTTKDLIRWSTTYSSSTMFSTSPQNVSDAIIHGVEFEYNKRLAKEFAGFFNYTYQNARDTSTNNQLNYAPAVKFNLGLQSSYFGLDSSLLVRHVGKRFANLANTYELDPYIVVDLACSRKIDNLTYKVSLDNVFDTTYAESFGFTDVYPMPGRRYNIKIGVDL